MKKVYFSLFMSLLVTFTFAQQIYLNEDFSSNQMPPEGWTIDNQAAQWSVENTANAGGIAPEARFKWIDYNGTSRLISPEIDLNGANMVVVAFNHYLDNYGGGDYKVGVATRSGGGDWTTIWEVAPNSNIGPEFKLFQIDNSDVGASDFQVCFFVSGNMYNINYWYLDNIKLLVPANLDAEMLDISTSQFVDGPVPVEGSLRNFGITKITSVDVEWEVNGDVHSTSFTGLDLDFGDSYDFTCADQFDFPIGAYPLSVRITNVNGVQDDLQGDDTLVKTISVVSSSIDKKPCFEEFTSSTCGPCAGFNAQFVPWCSTHEDDLTLVKYQMNWPGNGDPYYTEEGGVRRLYYGVTWVPWLEGDGEYTNTSTSAAQEVLDQAANELGLAKIASTFTITADHKIILKTTILPFANFEDFKFHSVVFEKETTQNTGSNGETSFQHVMMKMIPDANGLTVNLIDRQPYTVSDTVDLSGTNVEEWDDLGVTLILQDFESRKIYQSAYSVENGSFATEARLNSITVGGQALEGFDPDVYEYNIELPEGTTDVPEVDAQLMDENGYKVIVPATQLPGTTTIDAYAEDLETHITYTVNFTIAAGTPEETVDNLNVYPNPTTGKLFVSGMDISKVRVFSLTGAVVYENDNFNNNMIDLSNLEDGIYFMSVVDNENKTYTRKISLMK